MILQSVLILLVLLVIANIVLGILNKVSPPCNNAEEFFQNAKKIPSGVSSTLDTIPTESSGLFTKLFNKADKQLDNAIDSATSYIKQNTVENYINPVVHAMAEDESDCMDRERKFQRLNGIRHYNDVNLISDDAKNVIDDLFPTTAIEETVVRSNTDKRGSILDFNITTEDMQNNTGRKSKDIVSGAHLEAAHSTERDGYKSI